MMMIRKAGALTLALLAGSMSFAPTLASAQPRPGWGAPPPPPPGPGGVIVRRPPPPPRMEPVPRVARPGHVWAPGYWSWQRGGWVWIPGMWRPVRSGCRWTPDRWVPAPGGWRLVPGGWVCTGRW